jgi:hypothetical protein
LSDKKHTDQDWSIVLESVEISIGACVCLRTIGDGVVVGILAGAAGKKVALRDAFILHSWSGSGPNAGSVADMLDNPATLVIRTAMRRKRIVEEISSLDEIGRERYDQLKAAPRV